MSRLPVQAIVTRYLAPTNCKGSRIKATAAAGSVIVHIDHALNIEDNHAKAAETLANRFEWRGNWFQGGMPDDSGYCFVCSDTFEALAFTTPGRVTSHADCCNYHYSGGDPNLSCGGDQFTRSA